MYRLNGICSLYIYVFVTDVPKHPFIHMLLSYLVLFYQLWLKQSPLHAAIWLTRDVCSSIRSNIQAGYLAIRRWPHAVQLIIWIPVKLQKPNTGCGIVQDANILYYRRNREFLLLTISSFSHNDVDKLLYSIYMYVYVYYSNVLMVRCSITWPRYEYKYYKGELQWDCLLLQQMFITLWSMLKSGIHKHPYDTHHSS